MIWLIILGNVGTIYRFLVDQICAFCRVLGGDFPPEKEASISLITRPPIPFRRQSSLRSTSHSFHPAFCHCATTPRCHTPLIA